MRKMFLFLSMLFVVACSANMPVSSMGKNGIQRDMKTKPLQEYYDAIEQCDKIAKHDLKHGDLTTAGMSFSVDKQIICYSDIANKIIKKYYSKQSQEMTSNLEKFIELVYQVSLDMNMPDECYPQCGTIVTTLQRGNTTELVKKYLDTLIRSLDGHLNS